MKKTSRILVSLLIFLGLVSPILARTMTVDDVFTIKRIRNIIMAPNGKLAAYLKEESLWVVDISNPKKPLHERVDTGNSPQWLPDSSGISYLKKSPEKRQLFVFRFSDKKSQLIASKNTGIDLYRWNPDMKSVALVSTKITSVTRNALIQMVRLVDVASSSESSLVTFNQMVRTLDWDPQGKKLVFSIVTPTPDVQVGSASFILDVASKKMISFSIPNLPNQPIYSPRWTSDGQKIIFITTDGFNNFWLCTLQLGIYDVVSQRVTLYPQTIHPGIASVYGYSKERNSIPYLAEDGVAYNLYELFLSTGKVSKVTKGATIWEEFSFSKDFTSTVFLQENSNHPPELFVSSYPELKPEQISTFNSELRSLTLGETDVIRWKSKDKTEIEGLLIKPVGYVPGKTYPLITWLHGGPAACVSNRFANGTWHYPTQVLAAEGFMIFMPNPRGSTGYGPEFKKAHINQWGEIDYDDVMAGIEFLVKEKKMADKNRLGVCGWSYGGYLAAVMIAKSDLFQCGLCNNLSVKLTSG